MKGLPAEPGHLIQHTHVVSNSTLLPTYCMLYSAAVIACYTYREPSRASLQSQARFQTRFDLPRRTKSWGRTRAQTQQQRQPGPAVGQGPQLPTPQQLQQQGLRPQHSLRWSPSAQHPGRMTTSRLGRCYTMQGQEGPGMSWAGQLHMQRWGLRALLRPCAWQQGWRRGGARWRLSQEPRLALDGLCARHWGVQGSGLLQWPGGGEGSPQHSCDWIVLGQALPGVAMFSYTRCSISNDCPSECSCQHDSNTHHLACASLGVVEHSSPCDSLRW